MEFDLFQTKPKLSLTWVGDHSLQSLGCSQKYKYYYYYYYYYSTNYYKYYATKKESIDETIKTHVNITSLKTTSETARETMGIGNEDGVWDLNQPPFFEYLLLGLRQSPPGRQ
jgi:hypothetical protein